MKDKVCVMRNIGANGTIVVDCPIPVMMERESRYRDKKADEQER